MPKNHLLTYLTIILCLQAVAQKNILELRREVLELPEDTFLVLKLEKLGAHYLEVALDSSKVYASRGLELSEELDYSKGVIKHSNILGNYHQRKGDADSARIYYDRVLDLSQATDDIKGKAIALNNIAILHTYSGEYPEAIKLYQEALAAEEVIGDQKGIAEAYNNIGVVHYYMGDIPTTLEYFERSVGISEEIGDTAVVKKGYNNLGALYDYTKEYDKALEYFQKSYNLAEILGQKKEMGIMLNNIATTYSGKKDYVKAMDTYEESLALRREMQDHQGEANTLVNMAGDQYALGREKQAYTSIEQALGIAHAYELKFIRSEIYKRLIEYKRAEGRWEEALAYSDKFSALKDSLLNEERVNAVAEMETKFETEQKERLLLEEKAKNEQLAKEKAEAELKVNRRNTLLGITGAGALSLIFLGLFVMQRNKRKAESEKTKAVLAERDKGMMAVLNAQEEERSRISKDLHDGVGQQLSGLKLGFQLLKKELICKESEVNERLDKLSSVIDESASDVRTISHQMMPKSLVQVGLVPALRDMLEKSLGSCDIAYHFEELRPIGRMDRSLELNLYRVAQEVVNNIIKHSQAEHVDVQLYKSKEQIILTIEDDGIGFQPHDEMKGHGLLNIQNRSRLIQGKLDVESTPGHGTRISLRVNHRS
ncbi:MAG: sensor histidine kinase [Flavobacteriales bacterium]|nr:sensor histidine kinase [Flavobacteriales bacterium]